MTDWTWLTLGIIFLSMAPAFVIAALKIIKRDVQARRVNLARLREQFDRQPDPDEVVRALYAEHREGRVQ